MSAALTGLGGCVHGWHTIVASRLARIGTSTTSARRPQSWAPGSALRPASSSTGGRWRFGRSAGQSSRRRALGRLTVPAQRTCCGSRSARPQQPYVAPWAMSPAAPRLATSVRNAFGPLQGLPPSMRIARPGLRVVGRLRRSSLWIHCLGAHTRSDGRRNSKGVNSGRAPKSRPGRRGGAAPHASPCTSTRAHPDTPKLSPGERGGAPPAPALMVCSSGGGYNASFE
jgi:hypothetical protein